MKSFFLPVRPPLSSAMQLPKKQPLPRFITLPAAAAVAEAQVAVEAQAAVADTASDPPVLLYDINQVAAYLILLKKFCQASCITFSLVLVSYCTY